MTICRSADAFNFQTPSNPIGEPAATTVPAGTKKLWNDTGFPPLSLLHSTWR
jgi:hypothetical protein